MDWIYFNPHISSLQTERGTYNKRNYKSAFFESLFGKKSMQKDGLEQSLHLKDVDEEDSDDLFVKNALKNGIENDVSFLYRNKFILMLNGQRTWLFE